MRRIVRKSEEEQLPFPVDSLEPESGARPMVGAAVVAVMILISAWIIAVWNGAAVPLLEPAVGFLGVDPSNALHVALVAWAMFELPRLLLAVAAIALVPFTDGRLGRIFGWVPLILAIAAFRLGDYHVRQALSGRVESLYFWIGIGTTLAVLCVGWLWFRSWDRKVESVAAQFEEEDRRDAQRGRSSSPS